jgi:hypothetical protein
MTDSPFKNALEASIKPTKLPKMAKHASKINIAKEATSVKIISQRKNTRKKVEKSATEKKMPEEESKSRKRKNSKSKDESLYCGETYSNEGRIQCQQCQRWAHNSCAGVGKRQNQFRCEICTNASNTE